ncbi:hypothetical protein K0A97_01390 [Patescibacteria group bacterium]|nr:hypothetical protein [Patescibacteria group bacterium]
MNQNFFLERIPKNINEEMNFLYDIGVDLEDLEYLLKVKFRYYVNFCLID